VTELHQLSQHLKLFQRTS